MRPHAEQDRPIRPIDPNRSTSRAGTAIDHGTPARYRHLMPTDGLDVRVLGVGTTTHYYLPMWATQRRIHRGVVAGTHPPTVLVLEHVEVFTAGSRTQPEDRPRNGSNVVEVDRGGRITWHGPGQLVCYPIVPLPHPLDVVAHVRRLEEIAIRTCADFDVEARRVEGRSGAWVTHPDAPTAKIAAVGVRVSQGVTMHGLALNVTCDLSWANRIVPCGLTGAGVTSLAESGATGVRIEDVCERLAAHVRAVLAPALPLGPRTPTLTLDR